MSTKRAADASSEVGFCTGKDCRRSDGFRSVQRELQRRCDVVELACLDVCHGPVVVLEPRSPDAVVIERVRNRALVQEVAAHVVDREPLSARLRNRRLSGSKRAKARRRIERAI